MDATFFLRRVEMYPRFSRGCESMRERAILEARNRKDKHSGVKLLSFVLFRILKFWGNKGSHSPEYSHGHRCYYSPC